MILSGSARKIASKSANRPRPYSGFPVEIAGVGEVHAAFLNESSTRGCWWRPVQEIRIRACLTQTRLELRTGNPPAVESLFTERLIGPQRLQHKCVNSVVKVSSAYDLAVVVDARGHQ
jgi:hypothetical protein